MKLSEAIEALESGRFAGRGQRVLCAVSGGADSVALLNIMQSASHAAGYELLAAHVHHGIRAESDEELEFVTGLCRELGVELFTCRADVPGLARESGESVESAARRVRYKFFYRVACEQGCDLIALAHHSRDQAETVLMHALRGASVSGLCGMRPCAGMLIRPLLDVEPEELREYLGAHGIGFREDATNSDTRYTRNFVRHVILPDCEQAYPGSRAGLCRLARAAQRDDDFINSMADAAARESLFDYPGGFYLDAERMRGLHDAIGARIAARAMRLCGQDAQEAGVECILAALNGKGAGAGGNLPGDVRVSRGARRVYLELPDPGRGSHRAGTMDECVAVHADRLPARAECSLGALEMNALELCPGARLGDGIWEQTVDAAALCGAELRFRRAGDTIWPLGAPGEKKLKDFYIGKKVDRQIRGYLPVLARGSKVLWALGVGVSRDCAIGADTRSAVHLIWQGKRFWQ